MKQPILAAFLILLSAFSSHADVDTDVPLLPCGIYDQAVKAYIEKDLDTQSPDPVAYSMETATTRGKKLRVEVQNCSIRMQGERNRVSVFLDGKPLARTSHQDVPVYLEVHVDNEKYRIICTRGAGDELASAQTSTEVEMRTSPVTD